MKTVTSNAVKSAQLTLFSDADQWPPDTESGLASACVALGARTVAGWSAGEDELARSLPALAGRVVGDLRQKILAGDDPLGDLFCSLRSPEVRRKQGATFTPKGIVDAMVDWAARAVPQRVIDPGVGSGRFLVAAGRRFAGASGGCRDRSLSCDDRPGQSRCRRTWIACGDSPW